MSTTDLDPRCFPYRDDIAAEWLEGRVRSRRFVTGTACQVSVGYTTLRQNPDPASRQTSELLFGEVFVVYQEVDGWAWGQNQTDDYVGFTESRGLRNQIYSPSHRVRVLRTYIYEQADLKSPVKGMLSLNSRVQVVERRQRFGEVRDVGWVFMSHLAAIDEFAQDHVALAEQLVGTPYLWGGKTTIGLDCSGLVQIVLEACGHRVPRDSDLQATQVGQPSPGGIDSLERGDIMFFPGHVGIMADATRLINATAATMDVCVESWWEVARRAQTSDGTMVTAVRRLSPWGPTPSTPSASDSDMSP